MRQEVPVRTVVVGTCPNFLFEFYSVKNKRNRIFKINEKGITFFFELQRFITVVQTTSLRY